MCTCEVYMSACIEGVGRYMVSLMKWNVCGALVYEEAISGTTPI